MTSMQCCRGVPLRCAISPTLHSPHISYISSQRTIRCHRRHKNIIQCGTSLSKDYTTLLKNVIRPDTVPLAMLVAITAFSVGCFVFVAPALGAVIDTISQGTAATLPQLAKVVGTLGAIYLGSNVSLAGQVALASTISNGMAGRLRQSLFDQLLQKETSFFATVKTGQLTSWLGQDIEILESTVNKLLGARGVRAALESIGIVAMLLYLCWPLALALLFTAPLLTPLVTSLSGKIREASQQAQSDASLASAAADEIFENSRLITVMNAQQSQQQRYDGLAKDAGKSSVEIVKLQGILDAASRARNTLCVLVTLVLGAHLALAGQITIGVCYSFFVYSFSFAFALGNLASAAGDLARARGAVSRTLAVLEEVGAEGISGRSISSSSLDGHQANTIPATFKGQIEFRNVSFKHPGMKDWGLKDISFTIKPGQTCLVTGPSGSGKSSLASILIGLLQPDSGEIIIDDTYDLKDVDPQWWRRQLGVVEQSPGLIQGNVASVVAYSQGGHAARSEVEWAAGLASLPTALLEGRGEELSGGQRQRVALSRSLFKRPKVLILDEATSALDVETEANVIGELMKMRECTKVIITHRPKMVKAGADVVLMVADGRVMERK